MAKGTSSAAAALAKARWRRTTKAERRQVAVDLNQAKLTAMTPEERSAVARKAAAARWAKQKKKS